MRLRARQASDFRVCDLRIFAINARERVPLGIPSRDTQNLASGVTLPVRMIVFGCTDVHLPQPDSCARANQLLSFAFSYTVSLFYVGLSGRIIFHSLILVNLKAHYN